VVYFLAGIAEYLREDYEDKLVSFLKVGLIKDWEHLKEIIGNL